uniref:pollen receptor-like kinase 2 n=1 Tax=Erigeron canadensis TaxID=72917 RepID=UPI001CB92860|nr:pollen receptor-like kinase 2 [Erigeron canadensis]
MNKMMPFIKHFEHLQIQLELIKSATNNFSDDHCIGKGGFGNVYKAELALSKGLTMVALKRLNRAFGQGDPEFWKEVTMLSVYRHQNIVSLLGFCDDSGEKILVYEFAPRRSLDLYLDKDELTWARRLHICIGAARGLAYLHGSVGTQQQRVLHRDIKSSNILLDEDWNARISDLGLSKFGPANQQYTFLVSNAVGTIGYCDPLYVETGLLTKESDVYSFGVVLFEVFCGRLCIGNVNNKKVPLTGLVRQFYEQNKIDELVYSNIKDKINPDSLKAFTVIAYKCLNRDQETRPLMTEVVKMLENALNYQKGIQTQDHQEKNNITYDKCETFHFMRAGRQRFDLKDLLSGEAEVLGKGSLGTSYKARPLGVASDYVVKIFKLDSIKEEKIDFHAHMMMLGSMSHPNLLSYVACYYDDGDNRLSVTDFAVNGSLASHLHDKPKDGEPGLDWPTRLKIIQGIARGLDYLYHEFPRLPLPHGHLRSSSVLLDEAFNPLLADYALLPIFTKNEAKKHFMAYKSRDFTQDVRMTRKTEVWCLGILILEILTGKLPINYLEQGDHGKNDLGTWVRSVGKEEWSDKVFDKNMKWAENNEIEMIDLLEIGIHCCEPRVAMRWDMKKAIEKIQGLKEREDDDEECSSDSTQGEDSSDTPRRIHN